jgi:uncharacterized repeat protein (TIGR03803 family)
MHRALFLAALVAASGCGGPALAPAIPGEPAAGSASRTASPEKVLHSFGGSDGAGPLDGLIAGKQGAFYGTTVFGGIGAGTVFQLSPAGARYAESVLYSFKAGLDGSAPLGVVRRDGVLYGVTFVGGNPNGNGGVGWGTIFKLAPGKSGYSETVLYRFLGGTDAWEPNGPIVIDRSGSIIGSSGFGGSRNDGAVFKLTPNGSGYTESIVYSFPGGAGGQLPQAGVTIDRHGSIYGTTMYGGSSEGYCYYGGGCGTVFKLTPGSSGYSERLIYSFHGADGNLPDGAVSVDERTGDLYGTTYWGGAKGEGVLFKLARHGSAYSESVLHSFTGNGDGFLPEGKPLLEPDGTIYGTAALGGGGCHGIGCGTVFKLSLSSSGYAFRVLFDFQRPVKGAEPQQTNLLSDAGGAIYGTTRSGGSQTNCADGGPGGALGCGVVFRITQ